MDDAVVVVQKSWTRIHGDVVAMTSEFYAIALQFPHIAKLFANVAMERQKDKFAKMLNYLLGHLRSSNAVEALKCLAVRHAAYGVELCYYNEVGIAMVMVVKAAETKLGVVAWDAALDFSWRLTYNGRDYNDGGGSTGIRKNWPVASGLGGFG